MDRGISYDIDLSKGEPVYDAKSYFSITESHNFSQRNGDWVLTSGGSIDVRLDTQRNSGNVDIKLQFMISDKSKDVTLVILFNNHMFQQIDDIQNNIYYHDMAFSMPENLAMTGINYFRILFDSKNGEKLYIRRIGCNIEKPYTFADWMGQLDKMTPLNEINMPGTHDSASINCSFRTVWSCQNKTIYQQLMGGIRVLDVRLKVNGPGSGVVTCHGDLPGNEYQTFESLLLECREFLRCYQTECIVMSLRVDDWGNYSNDKNKAKSYIEAVLLQQSVNINRQSSIPLLRDAARSIFLINRIDETLRFGVPMPFQDNTDFNLKPVNPTRSFEAFVSDVYSPDFSNPKADKYNRAIQMIKLCNQSCGKGRPLLFWTFTTANVLLFGVYIMDALLSYWGKSMPQSRERKIGWLMFDYPFQIYNTDRFGYINIIDFIINSNFGYNAYANTFALKGF